MSVKQKTNTNKKYSSGRIVLIAILALLLIAMLFTAGFMYQTIKDKNAAEQWLAHMTDTVEKNTFYEGTYLDDVHLAGMTLKEAKTLFEKEARKTLEGYHVTLNYGDQSWEFNYTDIDGRIDWEDRLEEIFRIARSGDLENRYEEVEQLKRKNVRLKTTLTISPDLIKDEVINIAEGLRIEPIDANIEFYPDEGDKFVITPEKEGQMVDAEALFAAVEDAVSSGQPGSVEIETEALTPKYLKENLGKATSLIVSFSTDLLSSSSNRVHNVLLSLKNMNGTKINPGEVFSFNDTVGPRTKEAGFLPAPVIMPDKSMKDDWGGGVCQASTTVFYAGALAGLDIEERYHHSFPVAYVPAGLDASVVYGWADLKLRNNRETPIFIKTYSKGKLVYVEFWGEPLPNDGKYELKTELVEAIPAPTPTLVEDTAGKYVTVAGGQKEHVKSRPGYRINTFRILYEGDSQVSSETLVKNYYRPIQGTIYYKKGSDQPSAPAQEVTAPADSSEENADSVETNNDI